MNFQMNIGRNNALPAAENSLTKNRFSFSVTLNTDLWYSFGDRHINIVYQ